MEKETNLPIKTTKFEKIKNFLKKLFTNKTFCISLFFFLIYMSTDLVNNEAYREIIVSGISVKERLYAIGFAGFTFLRFHKIVGSACIFACMYWIIKSIMGKTKLTCFLMGFIAQLFGIINYVVMDARGVALSLSDIYSFETAMNVVKGIKVEIDIFFILSIIIFSMANIYLFKNQVFKNDEKKNNLKIKSKMIAIGLSGLILLFNFAPLMNIIDAWNVNNAYKFSGAGLAIMRMFKDIKIREPKGYDIKKVENLLNNYTDDIIEKERNRPNIIVVMNESFADLESVFNIKLTEDSLPFYRELISGENIISGVLHSSQFGGGTANVEYEFLTQNSTAFLPGGALPYQQYIMEEVRESLVSHLEEMGYFSYGIHSWDLSGYNRSKAYRLLQFDNIAFKENMPNLEYASNEYSTDSSSYEYVFDIMKNKKEDEKIFTFLVTVQNHFPYEYIDENDVQYAKEDSRLNSYMQFLNKSDDALKELVEFIRDYDEDTILLFYGDHQPNLDLKENYGVVQKYNEDEANYIVPFFIWANYDIEEKENIETSTNYLQSIFLEALNMPKDKYTKYVMELREEIPVIAGDYYKTKEGEIYEIDDKESPYYEKITEYWNVIYYQMFDNIGVENKK